MTSIDCVLVARMLATAILCFCFNCIQAWRRAKLTNVTTNVGSIYQTYNTSSPLFEMLLLHIKLITNDVKVYHKHSALLVPEIYNTIEKQKKNLILNEV